MSSRIARWRRTAPDCRRRWARGRGAPGSRTPRSTSICARRAAALPWRRRRGSRSATGSRSSRPGSSDAAEAPAGTGARRPGGASGLVVDGGDGRLPVLEATRGAGGLCHGIAVTCTGLPHSLPAGERVVHGPVDDEVGEQVPSIGEVGGDVRDPERLLRGDRAVEDADRLLAATAAALAVRLLRDRGPVAVAARSVGVRDELVDEGGGGEPGTGDDARARTGGIQRRCGASRARVRGEGARQRDT